MSVMTWAPIDAEHNAAPSIAASKGTQFAVDLLSRLMAIAASIAFLPDCQSLAGIVRSWSNVTNEPRGSM
jgi:hypothetical protein